MSTLRDERQVYALRVRPKSVPKAAPQHTILHMCKIIEEMWKAQRATFYINDKGTITEDDEAGNSGMISSASNNMTNAIYIADVRIDDDNKTVTILFNRGDADRSDPAYVNPKTNVVRVPKRNDDESIGYSAHLVINYDDAKSIDGSYRVGLERVPSLTRSEIIIVLNRLLRMYAEESKKFSYKNKKDDEIFYRPRFDFTAQPAASFKEDLENNVLRNVILIKNEENFEGIDNVSGINSVKNMVKISMINNSNSLGEAMISKFVGYAKKNNFDEIQFEVFDKGHKGVRRPRFATDKAEAADVLYARIEIIDKFTKPLDQCCDKINTEIVTKISAAISSDEVWGL